MFKVLNPPKVKSTHERPTFPNGNVDFDNLPLTPSLIVCHPYSTIVTYYSNSFKIFGCYGNGQ